jgi:hypothetical protein
MEILTFWELSARTDEKARHPAPARTNGCTGDAAVALKRSVRDAQFRVYFRYTERRRRSHADPGIQKRNRTTPPAVAAVTKASAIRTLNCHTGASI